MAETLALGGEGASELPFCQRGRRRMGKARRADLARPCPFELRFAAPLRVSPGRGNWGTPPPFLRHRSRSDGIERGRGSVSSHLEKGCRPAIPHGSLPLSAPKVRMRCRWARVSGEGGASLPAHARQKRGPLALLIAARLHVPIAVVRTRHGPSPSGAPFSPPLAASPLLLARLFSLRTLSNPRFFLRMIDSGANGFDLCACTNRAKRRHETSCPMAG